MVSLLRNLLLLACVLLVVALFWLSNSIRQTEDNNRLSGAPETTDPQTQSYNDYPASVLFARAKYQSQQQETANALELYNHIVHSHEAGVPRTLAEASRYNGGLIRLQQALNARHSADKKMNTQFLPLLEMAIMDFREVLNRNPQHYDARLALEQALGEIEETVPNKAGWKENRSSVFSHVSGVAKGGP